MGALRRHRPSQAETLRVLGELFEQYSEDEIEEGLIQPADEPVLVYSTADGGQTWAALAVPTARHPRPRSVGGHVFAGLLSPRSLGRADSRRELLPAASRPSRRGRTCSAGQPSGSIRRIELTAAHGGDAGAGAEIVPPAPSTRGETAGQLVPKPLSPAAATYITGLPVGVVAGKWLSKVVSPASSAVPQLIETTSAPGVLTA
jgi:hypothetical protein